MYQTIWKNKWDMYANCKYIQNIFVAPLPCGCSKTDTSYSPVICTHIYNDTRISKLHRGDDDDDDESAGGDEKLQVAGAWLKGISHHATARPSLFRSPRAVGRMPFAGGVGACKLWVLSIFRRAYKLNYRPAATVHSWHLKNCPRWARWQSGGALEGRGFSKTISPKTFTPRVTLKPVYYMRTKKKKIYIYIYRNYKESGPNELGWASEGVAKTPASIYKSKSFSLLRQSYRTDSPVYSL
jgi:hypothetical protein